MDLGFELASGVRWRIIAVHTTVSCFLMVGGFDTSLCTVRWRKTIVTPAHGTSLLVQRVQGILKKKKTMMFLSVFYDWPKTKPKQLEIDSTGPGGQQQS